MIKLSLIGRQTATEPAASHGSRGRGHPGGQSQGGGCRGRAEKQQGAQRGS